MAMKRNVGYLLLSAIVLVVVIGLIAMLVARIAVTQTGATAAKLDASRSFYLAESGLWAAARKLFVPALAERLACEELSGHSDLTNVSLGLGMFTVTAHRYYATNPATLTANINATATIIPVTSLADYAPHGRIMVDREFINYADTSTDSGVCAGAAACFIGIVRGVGDTIATNHAAGTAVGQNQCTVTSVGTSGSAMFQTKRMVQADVLQLGEGWIVGQNWGGDSFLRSDNVNWYREGPYASVPDTTLNAVTMLSFADVWAVGNSYGGNVNINHWNGAEWTRIIPAGVGNKNLYGIYCNSAMDCWAVGDSGTFIHWNGVNWTAGATQGLPTNRDFNDVDCTASNNCFAVGNSDSNKPLIAQWNGTKWQRMPTQGGLPAKDLDSISCKDGYCFAVGQAGTFLEWPGSGNWRSSNVQTGGAGAIPEKQFSGVSCVSNSDCWAVGDCEAGVPLFAHWNGAIWSKVLPATSSACSGLEDVSCKAGNDCWAVGSMESIYHWDGSQWIVVANPVGSSNKLYGVDYVLSDVGAGMGWQQF